MIKIKKVIVVEGINDEIAVKRSVEAEVICVSGFGITNKTFQLIKSAQSRCGVILLTDSDFVGESIRNRIAKKIPGVKHAYISREKSCKNGDIGVENASPDSIIEALKNAKCILNAKREEFTIKDLIKYDLINKSNSLLRRERLGDILGIGYANGKKFLSRLNYFNISRDEFLKAINKLEEKENGY